MRLVDRGARCSAGKLGRPGRISPRLEDQDRDDGGQLGRVQSVPQLQAKRLGRHQIHLGVEAGESFAVGGDGVAVEVADLFENSDHAIEGSRDAAGAVINALLKLLASRDSGDASARPTERGPRGQGSR